MDTTLRYSSLDMLTFVGQLNHRIASVTQAAAKRGRLLQIGKDVYAQMKTARRLFHRYNKGDYRHTDYELGQCKSLADWLIARHAEMNGLDPKPWAFNPAAMVSKAPVRINGMKHG